jgi:hypothetical protein
MGAGVQDQPYLVSKRRSATGSIGRKLRLVLLIRFSACPG